MQRVGGWLDSAAFAVLCLPVLIFLLGSHWPHVLDGRDVLDSAAHGNYVRNGLELSSFAATTLVLVTAIAAFIYTRRQFREARDTRLAALYATLEARWSSADMQKSKAIFAQIVSAYEDYAKSGSGQSGEPQSIQQFAQSFIETLGRTDRAAYFCFMALPEFLEYIGMLEQQGYLQIDDIDAILGMVVIDVTTVLSDHIEAKRGRRGRTALPNAPIEFLFLTTLADKFVARYGPKRD